MCACTYLQCPGYKYLAFICFIAASTSRDWCLTKNEAYMHLDNRFTLIEIYIMTMHISELKLVVWQSMASPCQLSKLFWLSPGSLGSVISRSHACIWTCPITGYACPTLDWPEIAEGCSDVMGAVFYSIVLLLHIYMRLHVYIYMSLYIL